MLQNTNIFQTLIVISIYLTRNLFTIYLSINHKLKSINYEDLKKRQMRCYIKILP